MDWSEMHPSCGLAQSETRRAAVFLKDAQDSPLRGLECGDNILDVKQISFFERRCVKVLCQLSS